MLNDLGLNVIPPIIKSTTFFEKKKIVLHFHTQAQLAYRHAHLAYLRRRKSIQLERKQQHDELRNGYSESNLYENSRIFAPPVTRTNSPKLCNFMQEFTVSEPNFGSLPARIHAI